MALQHEVQMGLQDENHLRPFSNVISWKCSHMKKKTYIQSKTKNIPYSATKEPCMQLHRKGHYVVPSISQIYLLAIIARK